MATDALDLAAQLAAADPRTRDVALFRSAEDVLRNLETHYVRPEPPRGLDSLRGKSLETLRECCERDTAFGRSFGDFRDAVLTHEERCAQRLSTLRGTALLLVRLRAVATDPERIDRMLDELARFVSARWRLDLPLNDGPELRSWALRVSRRYDLLPPTWRSV